MHTNHHCFIQPLSKEQEQEPSEEDLFQDPMNFQTEDAGDENNPPPASILCFANTECYLDDSNTFVPNLICWSSEEDQGTHHAETLEDFIKAMEDLTKIEGDERTRNVFIYFHNMKGFDGFFVMYKFYEQGRAVERVLTQGAKVMSFQVGDLVFRGSMNFFNMALEKLPATFNLQELHKGFFPHSFNLVENFSYRSVYPDMKYYGPDEMSEKKREKFLAWHAEKIRSAAIFDFQKELLLYCQSDVQVLKQSCLKFVQEFKENSHFNPLLEAVTIASACLQYWRYEHLEEGLIAVEAPNGWRGNRVNQSDVALKWLYFED